MEKWLNKKVKHTTTGYVGVVTAFAVYNNGNEMVLVESIDTTGRPIEWWIHTQFAEVIE
jgi:UDP-glucose 6-dehydrogenase